MSNNVERDTKKSLDRLSTVSSSSSSHTFNLVDKTAKRLSDIREDHELEKSKEQANSNESPLKTSEQASNVTNETNKNVEEAPSRLKTSGKVESNNANNLNSTSRLKTNINNEKDSTNIENINGESNEEKTSKPSRLKTGVAKVVKKTFKFNDNQGKISKTATVISKTGDKLSKAGRTITRTSRELNKAMSSDGTGSEYIGDKIGRKLKTKTGKVVKKASKKITKPIKNKLKQTIGKKLVQITKKLLAKALKLLISALGSLSEIIIPAALVILIIVALGSIFGSGSSDNSTLSKYSQYMTSVQSEYNRQVDDWVKENPDGIVIGVDGDYGRIDWRIPLAIIHSTLSELNYDQSEKDLLQKFKDAGLYEKHEEVKQTVESTNDAGETVEKEIPVLIITNGMYEDYMDWCRKNYSYIADYNKKKKVTDGSDTWFSNDQLEILDMLYNSSDYAEGLGNNFKTHTPTFGSTETKANLKSKFYNSKNTLATSGFKGQCTWYAFGRALELTNKKMPTGNAQTWLSSAIAMGYATGTQPSAKSVVVLAGGKFGHVAFVEAYDGKSITISEGNVGNKCRDGSCSQVEYANEHAEELVRTKTYSSFNEYRKASKNSGQNIIGFIYLD